MWPSEDGSWGLPYIDTSFERPRTTESVAVDVVQQRQAVDDSGIGSALGSWFGGVASKVLDYHIAKDARETDAQIRQTQMQALAYQPLLSAQGGGVSVNPTGMLMIGGVVLLVVMLVRKG